MAANKMRTALIMLGIIIGIASVVSILVIGDAAELMVLADIKSIGTNTVDIYPGKGLRRRRSNLQAIAEIRRSRCAARTAVYQRVVAEHQQQHAAAAG